MSANRQNDEERNRNLHKTLKKIRGERADKDRKIEILQMERDKLVEMEGALMEQMEINRLKPKLAAEKEDFRAEKIKHITNK